MGGKHRAVTKPVSRFIFPILLAALLPVSISIGYLNLASDPVTQIGIVDPYAGTITIAASPPDPLPVTSTSAPPPTEIPGTDHTTDPKGSSPAPSESAPTSPLPSEGPATRGKDQGTVQSSSEPPKPKLSSKCANLESTDNVVRACNALMVEFPSIDSMGGKGNRPHNPESCHPLGLGLDVMVSDKQLGDAVNSWARTNSKKYGIAWIGWQVPDHYDHIHLSFEPCKG